MSLPMLSTQSLINWLRKQPQDRKYAYSDPKNCCLCHYFRAYGLHNVSVTPYEYYPNTEAEPFYNKPLPRDWDYIARGYRDGDDDTKGQEFHRTYGDALRRALELS